MALCKPKIYDYTITINIQNYLFYKEKTIDGQI